MTIELYPPIEPFQSGLLQVGEGNAIAWEVSGAPHGKPAVVVHGGPGQGSVPNMRRGFDPRRYRIILFDQRGCGRSTPHASDPRTEMAHNTTAQLIADMEALRVHLGIDRWLLAGGSWGCTLALAYAQVHPHQVSEVVLSSVTTSRRSEARWLYRDVALFFPEAWQRFCDHVGTDEHVIEAYAQRLEHVDINVRLAAARAWCQWEDAVLSLEPHPLPNLYQQMPRQDMLALVRICTHYLRHGAWLEEGALIRDAHKLKGIPGVLIHGRKDMSCPLQTAYALAAAWPGAKLHIVDDAGHFGSETKRALLLRTLDRFAES